MPLNEIPMALHETFEHCEHWNYGIKLYTSKLVLTLYRVMERASISVLDDKVTSPYSISPQLEPTRRLTGETLVEPTSAQMAPSPHVTRSPRLMPSSRASSLASIPELPPGELGDSRQHFESHRRSSSRTVSMQGPVMELLRTHGHQNHHALTLAPPTREDSIATGMWPPETRSPTNTNSPNQGHKVTLWVNTFITTGLLELTYLLGLLVTGRRIILV